MNFLKIESYISHYKALIAGFIVTIIGISLLLLTSCVSNKKEDLGTFETPETALKETHKALFLLSKNVNQGYKTVLNINEYEITKNKIFNIN